jgi:hypothetical protein
MPYRHLEGLTKVLNRLIQRLPSIDYSWIRRPILMLNISLYSPVVVAVNSSGISVHKRRE